MLIILSFITVIFASVYDNYKEIWVLLIKIRKVWKMNIYRAKTRKIIVSAVAIILAFTMVATAVLSLFI